MPRLHRRGLDRRQAPEPPQEDGRGRQVRTLSDASAARLPGPRRRARRPYVKARGRALFLCPDTHPYEPPGNPPNPTGAHSTVWTDTAERGQMLRQVRGIGALVPEQIRQVAAPVEGRVERINAKPGARGEARA